MKIIKTWDIAMVGWATFDAEVRAITTGRSDVKIFAPMPGKLVLIERQQPPAEPKQTRKQREAARQLEIAS